MDKLKVVNTVTRAIGRAGLVLRKHSPEILLGVGTVGVVASAVMACKATTKLSAILEETKDQVDAIHTATTDPRFADKYTEEDSKKDLTIVYAKTGLELVKVYGPAVALGAVSLGCIFASSNIMRKRNIALAAAYMTEHTAFKEYRERLIERFDKGLDRELRYNIRAKEVEETVMQEDGTEQVVKKTVEVAEVNEASDYARFFDDGCKGWTKDPELNLYRVRQAQTFANQKLDQDGFLFLNDVYEMLGIPKTQAGQIVGWIRKKGIEPIGDGYVDFGIYDLHNERKRAFVNGHERTILLDFNVDGPIHHLI
jgi:hypothetical protein